MEVPLRSRVRLGTIKLQTDPQRQHTRLRPTSGWLWLSLAQLISWGSVFYTFTVIMGPLERDLGLTRVQSSLGFSLALLAGLCLLAHGRVTHIAGLYAVWMGLGLAGAGMLYAPMFAVVTRRFPQDFRRDYHLDLSGRPGQYRICSADSVADRAGRLAPRHDGAGPAAPAGLWRYGAWARAC